MTSPRDIYLEATRRGLRLEPAGDKLAVIPKGKCPPDFADVLRRHKHELLSWLSSRQCPGWRAVPPNNLPLTRRKPCPEAGDARRIVDYLVEQIDGTDALCQWLVKRETAYWETFGWQDELCCYAAATDAASWQLNRNEPALWEFLASISKSAAAAAH